METCLAAVVDRLNHIVVQEFALPEIGEDDGLLKVEMAGACGTDYKIYDGRVAMAPLPIIMGHEILGHVAKIGGRAARRWGVKEGDRVVVEGSVGCMMCDNCRDGNYRFCVESKGYGVRRSSADAPHLWGAFAQYMYLAPGSLIHKVSDRLSPEAGCMITAVISNGVYWARWLGKVKIGDTVLIQGVGQQGLSCVVGAKESGATTIIVTGLSRDAQRMQIAKRLGADFTIDVQKENLTERVLEITAGKLPDVVLDVSGNPEALVTSMRLTKAQGVMVSAGLTGRDTLTPFPMDEFVLKEMTMVGAFSKPTEAVLATRNLLETGRHPVEEMVTHRYRLEQTEECILAIVGKIEGEYPAKAVIVP